MGDKALNTAQNLAALNKANGNGEKVNYTGAKSSIKSIVPNEITLSALTSKLVLLTIHYPDLRIIWSRSPYATCDIFRALKSSNAPVNIEKAVHAGTEEWIEENDKIKQFKSENGNNKVVEESPLQKASNNKALYTGSGKEWSHQRSEDSVGRNILAYDILLKLPGVYTHNVFHLMQSCDTLAEVSNLDEEEMGEILGKVNGKKLYNFFNLNASL